MQQKLTKLKFVLPLVTIVVLSVTFLILSNSNVKPRLENKAETQTPIANTIPSDFSEFPGWTKQTFNENLDYLTGIKTIPENLSKDSLVYLYIKESSSERFEVTPFESISNPTVVDSLFTALLQKEGLMTEGKTFRLGGGNRMSGDWAVFSMIEVTGTRQVNEMPDNYLLIAH